MTKLQFGRVQMRIMQVLWEKKRATAREITDALNKFEPIAHKNVQTLIRILEDKSVVAHEIDNRTHIYYPLVTHEKVIIKAVRDFIDNTFQGSVGGLVSSIVKNRYMTPEELREIFKMFNEEEK